MTPTPVPRTLEIIIQPDAGPADGSPSFPLLARLVDTDQTASGTLKLPFSPAQLDRALNWIEDGLFNDGYVRAFGGQLFDALFVGPVRDLYRELRRSESSKSRIRILTGDARAARVPWELLYDSERQSFVALDLPVVRGLPLTGETRPLAATDHPLRVLLVESFPTGLPRLQGGAEAEDVRAKLAGLARSRRVETQRLSRGSLSELQNALREAATAGRPYHVLHFIGHGRSDRETGRAVLLFEAEDGQPQEVSPATLAATLAEFGVRLAFLNACQSAQSSAFDLAEGFAPALLSAGVPCVVGMQVGVLDEVARRFASEFYAALADNQPVDLALTHARRLALGEGGRRQADMAIPVCYLRPPSGQILDLRVPETVPLTRATLAPWLAHNLRPGRLLRSGYGVLAVVGTLLGLYLAVQAELRDQEPGTMDGDFNIAVAAFGELDEQGSGHIWREGEDLAARFASELQANVSASASSGGKILVWGPDKTGFIRGDTPAARERAAQAWADEHNAHLVIYGYLRDGFTKAELLPEFLIVNRQLGFAEELAGHYQPQLDIAITGADVSVRNNAETIPALRSRLMGWADEIARFVLGLGSFNQGLYQQALTELGEPAAGPQGATPQWRKVIDLFRGSAAAAMGDLDQAALYYDRALEVDATYARARLGRTQIDVLRAQKQCSVESGTDVQALSRALATYQQIAQDLADDMAEIDLKVKLFSGSAALCRDTALAVEPVEAIADFSAVIDAYTARDGDAQAQQRIRYLAADAYIRRGVGRSTAALAANNGDLLAAVRSDLDEGRRLAVTDDRVASASWELGALHMQTPNPACETARQEIARGDQAYADFRARNPGVHLELLSARRCDLRRAFDHFCSRSVPLADPVGLNCAPTDAAPAAVAR